MRENVNELSTCLAEIFNFGDTGLFLFLHGVGLKLSRGISVCPTSQKCGIRILETCSFIHFMTYHILLMMKIAA